MAETKSSKLSKICMNHHQASDPKTTKDKVIIAIGNIASIMSVVMYVSYIPPDHGESLRKSWGAAAAARCILQLLFLDGLWYLDQAASMADHHCQCPRHILSFSYGRYLFCALI